MEDTMCDYSLEAYRSRPARLGERYETHRFESYSIGFVAPGDPSTAVCMSYDTKLRLEGIPEVVQRSLCVSANEDVTFTRLEGRPTSRRSAVRQWSRSGAAKARFWCEGLHQQQRSVVTSLGGPRVMPRWRSRLPKMLIAKVLMFFM